MSNAKSHDVTEKPSRSEVIGRRLTNLACRVGRTRELHDSRSGQNLRSIARQLLPRLKPGSSPVVWIGRRGIVPRAALEDMLDVAPATRQATETAA